MTKKIHILLSGSNRPFTDSIRALLQAHPDLTIAGQVSDSDDLTELLKQVPVAIVLFCNSLPAGEAERIRKSLSRLSPPPTMILLDSAAKQKNTDPYLLTPDAPIGLLIQIIRAASGVGLQSKL